MTGIVGIELTKNYPIYNALKTAGGKIGSFFSSASRSDSSASPQSFCTTFSGLCLALTAISDFFVSIFQSVSTGAETLVTFIKGMADNNYAQSIQFIQGLQKTVFKQQEIAELLKDPQLKLPKLINFFLKAENRKTFQELFLGESLSKTQETFKILAGQATGPKSIFRVQEGLLTHIMNKFLLEPEEAIKKIDRLSKLIGSVSKKNDTAASSVTNTAQSTTNLEVDRYQLNKEKIDKFFQKREENAQKIYEDIMLMEIGLHQLGLPIPSRGTSIVNSLFAGFLGSLIKGNSAK